MSVLRLSLTAICLASLAACTREPPARTVMEFMDDPLLLEAALVRCTQNRAETRYEAECVNAREAVKLIEARDEAAQRERLEAESQRKRDALRRTQQAAAEARRRMLEAERQRQEQDYLDQFGELPPEAAEGNAPLAVVPASEDPAPEGAAPDAAADVPGDDYVESLPTAGSNAPAVETAPNDDGESVTDLQSIRDELKRRSDDDQ